MAAQEPTAPEIFEPLVKAGEVELQRGPKDLALSGFIAGLDIGFGPLAMAVVAGRLHEAFHLAMAQAQTTVPTVLQARTIAQRFASLPTLRSPASSPATGVRVFSVNSSDWPITTTTKPSGYKKLPKNSAWAMAR